MALVFDQQPPKYVPVFNQSPWVVRETDTSGTLNDWRMLCRVISLTNGTVEVARFAIRFRDNTERRVVFDPSEVLQGLISNDFEPMVTTGPWMLAPNSLHWYVVNFQSQKLVSGVWVTQNQFTPERRCVWNAALDAYVFPSYTENSFTSQQDAPPKPLTSYIPNLAPIASNDSYWIQFLSADEQAPLQFEITKYPLPNLQGVALPADPAQANSFGLAFTGLPSIGGDEFTRPSVRVGIGPRDLAAIASPISFVGVQSYRIRFTSTTSGPSTAIDFSFNINNCSKYPPTRLHWLNKFGGFDSWTFGMKSHEEEKVDRRQFYAQPNVLTFGAYGYDTMSRGTTDYHIGLMSELTLNTDLLTDADLQHLRQLVSSPVVFIDGGSAYDYLSVNVVDRSWTQKRGKQDGTFNLEIKVKPSMDSMRQRG